MKMKLVLVHKGGSGSGDYGHSGRPGEVGGSSGGHGGTQHPLRDEHGMRIRGKLNNPGSAKMLTDDEIDEAVYGTGFNNKTKGLKAYARQGFEHPSIKAIREKYSKIIPKKHLTAFAAYITNAKANGALATMVWAQNGSEAWDKLMSNIEVGRTVYRHMRPATLDNWSDAIGDIDHFNRRSI